MLDFFRRLFNSIFGKKESDPQETTEPKVEHTTSTTTPETTETTTQTNDPQPPDPNSSVENETEETEPEVAETANPTSAKASIINPEVEADLNVETESGKLWIDIVRFDSGNEDTLGKLYLDGKFTCYTLEDPAPDHIAAGEYEGRLNTATGRHATYRFRFKDVHQGMLSLGDSSTCIHIGNRAVDTQSSIVVGKQIVQLDHENGREVWKSDIAYLDMYSKVIAEINGGKTAMIRVSSV